MQCIQEDREEPNASICTLRYYLIPCFFFFDRSHKLLDLVLKMMGSLITDSSSLLFPPKYATDCSSRINAIVSVLLLMHKDVKVQQIISSLKAEVDHILRKILSFQVQFCISRMSLSMS
jgi:pre-rRNA-processing protein IPI1